MFRGGPCPPLYIRGNRVTWKVLAEYSWNPTTIQSDSFLCTVASSMPNRVFTKEVRYIHELSLTLEHSMSVSSPAAPSLTLSQNVFFQIFLKTNQFCHVPNSPQALCPNSRFGKKDLRYRGISRWLCTLDCPYLFWDRIHGTKTYHMPK